MSTVTYSLIYMCYRGLWLGLHPFRDKAAMQEVEKWLDVKGNRTYISLIIVWFMGAYSVMVAMAMVLSSGLELWLRDELSSVSPWLRLSYIPGVAVIFFLLYLMFRLFPELH